MSLDLAQLLPQVDALAREAARRAESAGDLLARARQALEDAAALAPDALAERVGKAGDRWSGALPTDEPLNATFPPPPLPEDLHILGADGSQIYPDRHAPVLYYLINIGCLHIRLGTGNAPETHTHTRLFYQEADLYDAYGGLIDRALVNGRRDVAEMAALADLAEACQGAPALALLDNGLLLWLALQVQGQATGEVRDLIEQYLIQMDRLKQSGAALAGFVDRPRNANVLALLHLASLPPEAIDEANLQANPYRGLTDRALFAGLLPPGHRSARFVNTSPVNKDNFTPRGHEVQFFYLNTGGEAGVVRVEVPAWVGEDAARMAWVHAGLLEQGRTTGGFPFALVRAHELAVVSQAERRSLENILSQSLLQHGLAPQRSQKAVTKGWLGNRRRHRP